MFEITIRERKAMRGIQPKEWKPVSRGENGETKYDYTPEVENIVERDVTVYERRIDAMDLRAVIAVIDGLHTNGTK